MNNVDNFSSITDRGKAFLSINGKEDGRSHWTIVEN